MRNALLTIIAIAWPPLAAWLILRLIPSSISKFVTMEIERRSDTKLERAKAEIQSSYATLKTSVDMLISSNTGLHPHIIDSVSKLWETMLAMREKYGSLILFDQIITVDEATTAFSSQDTEPSSKILKFVGNYRGDIENLGIVERFFTTELENHRLYCGDRLWLVFYVFRAVLARRAMLISSSFQKKEFRDWRHDSGIKQLLNSALPADFVNDVLSKDLNGLSTALARLEAEFLHEATKVMSGSKAIADSLADVQAIMQLQNAKVAERVK